MFEILVFLVVFVIIGQMWTRIHALELRLESAESPPIDLRPSPLAFAPPPEPDAPLEPRWWDGPREVEPERLPEPAIAIEPEPAPLPKPEPERIPEPEPEPEPDQAEPQRGFGFEELFGRRLPIWAGGITLAVAGVLIVRYSIEAGLLSPLVRFIAGLVFGGGLIAAAELALRFEDRVRDPRVRQALAGAGIATLYASILVGVNLYGLIGPMTAFAGMAVVTAAAMALSLRFGAASALLGLVGGLAAPALVGAGEPNVPLLTIYLASAVTGLSVLARTKRWTWLGIGALTGGLGWGVALLLGGVPDLAGSLSIGSYLFLLGVVLPLVALPARAAKWVGIGESLVAATEMAALVATGGFTLLHWGLFGLISVAIVWLARREEMFERLPIAGLALGLALIAAWPNPAAGPFALVLIAAALIYGTPPLLALWRSKGGLLEVAQIAALSLGGPLLATIHFHRAGGGADLALAGTALAAAAFPGVAAALGWLKAERRQDWRFALLVCTAALLAGAAACFAIPIAALPLAIAVLAGGLLLLSLAAEDRRIEPASWAGALAAVVLLVGAPGFEWEAERLFGISRTVDVAMALLRWGGLAGVALLFAGKARLAAVRGTAQAAAAAFLYGAAAQLVPAQYLSLAAPAGLLGLALAGRRFPAKGLLPALAVTLAISLCWTALPLSLWIRAALESLAGHPLVAVDLPSLRDTVQRLLVPALLIAGSARAAARRIELEAGRAIVAGALALGLVAAHILFKQIFGLTTHAEFVARGLAERTLWEALLLGAAAAAWKLGSRPAAYGLSGAALAHLGWYGLTLHNPLWAEQAVGPWPLLNLLLCLYGLPLALLALAPRIAPDLMPRLERPRAVVQMLLVVLLAFSTLRQLVHGSILVAPGLSQGEDIARSILAVALAIVFLLWGMKRRSRSWRIGSLVLMLAAVAKVFLLDASGLEGLMRIASFVALGFSLIGIGWLYSRSLSSGRAD